MATSDPSGVELNFLGADGSLAFSQEVKEQYGFQFAIGVLRSNTHKLWYH